MMSQTDDIEYMIETAWNRVKRYERLRKSAIKRFNKFGMIKYFHPRFKRFRERIKNYEFLRNTYFQCVLLYTKQLDQKVVTFH